LIILKLDCDFERYGAGSNASVSALCFWLCVQLFTQSESHLTSAISSKNSVSDIIQPHESENVSLPADSSDQAILGDDREVVPITEPEGEAVVDAAADADNS
jgi:hypothetical protein